MGRGEKDSGGCKVLKYRGFLVLHKTVQDFLCALQKSIEDVDPAGENSFLPSTAAEMGALFCPESLRETAWSTK